MSAECPSARVCCVLLSSTLCKFCFITHLLGYSWLLAFCVNIYPCFCHFDCFYIPFVNNRIICGCDRSADLIVDLLYRTYDFSSLCNYSLALTVIPFDILRVDSHLQAHIKKVTPSPARAALVLLYVTTPFLDISTEQLG